MSEPEGILQKSGNTVTIDGYRDQWVTSTNHVCYAGDPSKRGKATAEHVVQGVIRAALAWRLSLTGARLDHSDETRTLVDAIDVLNANTVDTP